MNRPIHPDHMAATPVDERAAVADHQANASSRPARDGGRRGERFQYGVEKCRCAHNVWLALQSPQVMETAVVRLAAQQRLFT